MITLGLVQAPATDRWEENLIMLEHFSRQAAAAGCSCVCFPECFLTGYAPERCDTLSLPAGSSALQKVSAIAAALQLDILTGFMEVQAGAFYITHGLFRQDGTVSYYRKTHLGQREQQFFTAGDALPVFSLSCGIPAGIALCVETHFPEITQTLSLKGAQIVFAPHAVPAKAADREALWNKIIPARSYDNRIYMACCNLCDGTGFAGGCLVTDPNGERVCAHFESTPALVTAPIDETLPSEFRIGSSSRRKRYYPALRRPQLYD